MSEPKFPTGWDTDRVKRLIDHYDSLSEDEQVAEDEQAAAGQQSGQTVVTVPDALLPAIRQLLATYKPAPV